MKRLLLITFLTLFCAVASAQSDNSTYLNSYNRQVRIVGASGVGVESIINRWEAALPQDAEAKLARFSYYFDKSQSSEVQTHSQKRYLGQQPVLALKDSLGADVYYYNVTVFVDSLYAESMRAIDAAIELRDNEMRYRFVKVAALLAYEKESPDLAAEQIMGLIDEYAIPRASQAKSKSSIALKDWQLDGQPLEESSFVQAMSEYCYNLFQVATPASYEYFKSISEKMNKLYPKETVFIDNLGSYWQVVRGDNRKAIRYYKQALKINPEDYAATTNLRIIEKTQKNKARKTAAK